MGIYRDEQYHKEVGEVFGEYLASFKSKGEQVRALIFRRGETMIAYVSFAEGLGMEEAKDPWRCDLVRFAQEKGYAGRLRFVMT